MRSSFWRLFDERGIPRGDFTTAANVFAHLATLSEAAGTGCVCQLIVQDRRTTDVFLNVDVMRMMVHAGVLR